jgi:hypothetical protein
MTRQRSEQSRIGVQVEHENVRQGGKKGGWLHV